jgi:putative chitinase
MTTHIEMLKETAVSNEDAEQYIDALVETLPKYGITASRQRLAHFFSQVLHESGGMRYDMENPNYSAKALRAVFRKYFPTIEDAQAYARNPEKIANRVYASRMGNRSEASGDGWKYRGRGLIQLTGKNNYRAFAKWIGDDRIMDEPDLIETEYAVQSAVFYWDRSKLNRVADKNDVVRIAGKHETIRADECGVQENLLEPVFSNGKPLRDESLEVIRSRVCAAAPHSSTSGELLLTPVAC